MEKLEDIDEEKTDVDENLREDIRKLNENFNKLLAKKKVKPVKLKNRLSKFQAKHNWVYILYINENKEWKPIKCPIEEATTLVEGIPRLASPEYMTTYLGKPAMILPAWSVKPFSPVESYEETVKDQMSSAGYRLLLNRIEQGEVKTKKRISGTLIFFIIIALIVGGYLLLT